MIRALLHILLPIITAVIINVIIYTQGWNNSQKDSETAKLLPPGYAIAIIWVFILGLLGYTHYLVYRSYVSFFIVGVILYCLAYPFLTNGLQANRGDFYNIIALILAIMVSIFVFMKNKKAVIYTIPFLIWAAYVGTVTLIKYNK